MKYDKKIVQQLPLQELWDSCGALKARRLGWASRDAIRSLLRSGPIWFVVANVGDTLRWVEPDQSFTFWKGEVKDQLADRDRIDLDNFPGGYVFVASQWDVEGRGVTVVLEAHH